MDGNGLARDRLARDRRHERSAGHRVRRLRRGQRRARRARTLYANYTEFGGYRIPAYGEVGWLLPDGLFTYWHGTITAYEPVD